MSPEVQIPVARRGAWRRIPVQDPGCYDLPVLPTLMSEAESQLRLQASTSGLADRVPLVSARSLFSKGQRNFVIGLFFLAVVGAVVSIRFTCTVILAFFTFTYLL